MTPRAQFTGIYALKTEMSWCQLCRYWWHQRLSLWQPLVPPVTTKLASWQLLVFSVYRQAKESLWFMWTSYHFLEVLGDFTKSHQSFREMVSAVPNIIKNHWWPQRLWRQNVKLCNISRVPADGLVPSEQMTLAHNQSISKDSLISMTILSWNWNSMEISFLSQYGHNQKNCRWHAKICIDLFSKKLITL